MDRRFRIRSTVLLAVSGWIFSGCEEVPDVFVEGTPIPTAQLHTTGLYSSDTNTTRMEVSWTIDPKDFSSHPYALLGCSGDLYAPSTGGCRLDPDFRVDLASPAGTDTVTLRTTRGVDGGDIDASLLLAAKTSGGWFVVSQNQYQWRYSGFGL